MIDLHILRGGGTDNPHWKECIESVDTNIFTIHEIKSVGLGLDEARIHGYSCGYQEYLAYLDDDDFLTPNAGETCMRAIKDGPSAVFTDYNLVFEDGTIRRVGSTTHPHPLIVVKRKIANYAAERAYTLIKEKGWHSSTFDVVMQRIVQIKWGYTKVDEVAYNHRYHDNGLRNKATESGGFRVYKQIFFER